MKARLAATLTTAALILATATGCTFITPQATVDPYFPSDGFETEVGDVLVRNALLISEDGTEGALSLALVNRSGEDQVVKIQFTDASGAQQTETVNVSASDTVRIPGDQQLTITDIDAEVGGLFPVFFQYGTETGSEIRIPVLDGTLPEYADLAP